MPQPVGPCHQQDMPTGGGCAADRQLQEHGTLKRHIARTSLTHATQGVGETLLAGAGTTTSWRTAAQK